MCSVSWEWNESPRDKEPCFSLWFNRDESIERSAAIPPATYLENKVSCLMPIDPDANGTWMVANEFGLVVCLLNLYEAQGGVSSKTNSRGLLVRSLASCENLTSARGKLEELLQSQYRAFSLVVFDVKSRKELSLQWNGKKLKNLDLETSFFSSSSWNTEEVIKMRQNKYISEVIDGEMKHHDFHRLEWQGEERSSPFMTREVTRTVSVTAVHVSHQDLKMNYFERLSSTEHKAVIPRHLVNK